MGLPSDPWRNPDFVRRRPPPVQRAWRSGRKRVFSVLLATAGLYAVWSLVAGQHGILEIWAQGRREAEVRAEIAETKERLAELDRKFEDIELAVEERARVEYGYTEPNELIFVDSTAVASGRSGVGRRGSGRTGARGSGGAGTRDGPGARPGQP